ncbi:MAG: hypothetical protein V4805_03825 [Pseudomonadota bacterium]
MAIRSLSLIALSLVLASCNQTLPSILTVIGMSLPASKAVIEIEDNSDADITIEATGKQWQWGYQYLKGEGEGIAFQSAPVLNEQKISASAIPGLSRSDNYLIDVDNPVVVPFKKKIRLVLTADDVIHAWSVPALGMTQDAIPGFLRETSFRTDTIGTYRGQCAELCGKNHAFMPIVIKVVNGEEYKQWVDSKLRKK